MLGHWFSLHISGKYIACVSKVFLNFYNLFVPTPPYLHEMKSFGNEKLAEPDRRLFEWL